MINGLDKVNDFMGIFSGVPDSSIPTMFNSYFFNNTWKVLIKKVQDNVDTQFKSLVAQ